MVTKAEAVQVLFPSAKVYADFRFSETGFAYWNPTLGTQPTQAELDAVTQAQVDAALLAKVRAAAKQYHLNLEAENRALRATVKLVVDELNLLRQWMADMKLASATSTNYATLKANFATLPATPDRTYAQAKNAIETLLDGD